MTKTARVYKIEMLIRNRGHVSFQALLDELEVSPATLKRDLEYLKDWVMRAPRLMVFNRTNLVANGLLASFQALGAPFSGRVGPR